MSLPKFPTPHPLTSHQQQLLSTLPHDWEIAPTSFATNHAFGTLVARGFAERQRLGDSWQWRRKPKTFLQAVQDLVDAMPSNPRVLRDFAAREQLAEVRRQLAAGPSVESKD